MNGTEDDLLILEVEVIGVCLNSAPLAIAELPLPAEREHPCPPLPSK